MSTAVISGRVDEDIKRRADVIIRKAGTTPANIINDVWQSIVATGELPQSPSIRSEQDKKRAMFNSFMEWFSSLPAQNGAYAHMSDDEILELQVNEDV